MNEQALLAAIGAMMDEKLEAGLKPIKEGLAKLEKRTEAIEKRTTKLEITVEHKIDQAIKLLGEGHESLRQTIEERLSTKEQQEKSDVRIFALEEIAKKHTAQIEELQEKIS